MALLTVHGHPLQAHYSGPFLIERKVNDVDYVIKTPGRRKTNRLFHVNMLEAYHEREPVAVVATTVATQGTTERLDSCAGGMSSVEIADKGPKLQNSDILSNLDQKLAHPHRSNSNP